MQQRKHLAIDLRWIESSGVGNHLQGILPGIVENLGDVDITCIGSRDQIEQFDWSKSANIRIVDCHAARYSLSEQIQVPIAIPADTDLFFCPYYTIPLLYRGPLAVTVHDMSHLVVKEIVGSAKKRLYAKLMFQELRRRASLIFTISEFSRSEFLRLTSGRNQAVIVTPLGVSEEWSGAAALTPIRKGPYFVTVGNVKPYKNLRRLVKAFLNVKEKIPQDLVIVGQSEGLITGESADFFELVRAGGKRIHLTGFVPHSQLLSLVGHATALLMPSLYEGFGLPPLEAMAAGVPAVVSHVASLPEVCGDAALYFDPLSESDMAEKLVQIALDAELSADLRSRGLARSRTFSWDTCAQQTADGLRSVLGGPAAG